MHIDMPMALSLLVPLSTGSDTPANASCYFMNDDTETIEEKFERQYKLIRSDVDTAINCFVTYHEIHVAAADSKDVLQALNRATSFWNHQLYSLQLTFFIVLARIFDKNGDAHSMHKFFRIL